MDDMSQHSEDTEKVLKFIQSQSYAVSSHWINVCIFEGRNHETVLRALRALTRTEVVQMLEMVPTLYKISSKSYTSMDTSSPLNPRCRNNIFHQINPHKAVHILDLDHNGNLVKNYHSGDVEVIGICNPAYGGPEVKYMVRPQIMQKDAADMTIALQLVDACSQNLLRSHDRPVKVISRDKSLWTLVEVINRHFGENIEVSV